MLPASVRKVLLPLCAAVSLAGCGGGGGGDDTPPPPPPPNRAPVITTTALAATEDTTLAAQIGATDADGNTLAFTRVNDVQHGTITISATGAAAYTPAANYAGADTFSVRVTDGAGGEATGTVTITVAAVNDAPSVTFTAFNIAEDMTFDGNVLPADVDSTTLTVTRTSAPLHGQVTVNASGLFNYVPSLNYFGTDSFNVRVADGAGGETPATITITISADDDVPVLVTNALAVNEDNVLSTQLVSTDAEGQTLTYSTDEGAEHGQVTISSSGLLTYTPDPNYFGVDSLWVFVSDDPQRRVQWPLTITVNPVNDAPVATDDEFRIATGAPKTMAVTGNDSDVEAGALTVTVLQQPAGGTVTVGANNLLTFTPVNDFAGPITFSYRLTDSNGGHDDASVRALIGTFQGLVYLADDFTTGRREIFLFDGLNSRRIVDAPAIVGHEITRFALSGDGSTLIWVVAVPLVDEVYVRPLNAVGPGTRIFYNSPASVPSNPQAQLSLNRSGSYALIENRYSSAAKRIHVVNTATDATSAAGSATLLGGDEPQVVRGSIVLFNPQNGNQVVLQGQIGGAVPTTGSEYYSAFVADVATPRDLTQISGDYAQLQGDGSGYGFWFGGSGRYIYHTEAAVIGGIYTKTLLMYDHVAGNETVMYRRATGTERGLTTLPGTNADGSKVCFGFTTSNPNDPDGPAAHYVTGPTNPSVATQISPVYPRVSLCWFGSDGDTVILQPHTASGNRQELYSVSGSNPQVPVKISHPLDTGEVLARSFVARTAPRMIIGYRYPPSEVTRLYSVPISGSGPEIPVATNVPFSGHLNEGIDASGQLLAYAPVEGSRRALRILSTQTLDYSIAVTGPAGTLGVSQFVWLPLP